MFFWVHPDYPGLGTAWEQWDRGDLGKVGTWMTLLRGTRASKGKGKNILFSHLFKSLVPGPGQMRGERDVVRSWTPGSVTSVV